MTPLATFLIIDFARVVRASRLAATVVDLSRLVVELVIIIRRTVTLHSALLRAARSRMVSLQALSRLSLLDLLARHLRRSLILDIALARSQDLLANGGPAALNHT
jgi:hypothetical protein